MRIKKTSVWFFIKTLGIKLFSLFLWLLLAFLIRSIFMSEARNWTKADLAMGMIELFIGLAPAYLIWVALFSLIRNAVSKQKSIAFNVILSIVLTLNIAEHLLVFGYLHRIVQITKYYGLFHAKTWAALPDFPEIVSLIMASVVFAMLYYRFVEKRLAPISD